MKHILFILVCLTILVACNSKPTSTPVPEIAQTASVLPTTTYTSVPNTDTPSPENTATPTLLSTTTATLLPTDAPLPTITPPPPPPPEGIIAFLWDPDPLAFQITRDLYFAWPGSTPGEWQQEVVIEAPNGFLSMFASPDKTKLALTQSDGTWQAINIPDNIGVYIYNLTDSSYRRLGEQTLGTSTVVAWLPDSQSITYSVNGTDIYQAFLDGSPPHQLTSVAGVAEDIFNQAWSPDGRILAFETLYPGRLFVFYADTNELVNMGKPIDFGLKLQWSPDSKWLSAFHYLFTGGLLLINAETQEKIEFISDNSWTSSAWSPYESVLAFTQEGDGLFLWDANTQIISQITSGSRLVEPIWSPDGSSLVAVDAVKEMAKLLVINTNTHEVWFPIQNLEFDGLDSLIWSPNNQWILFQTYTRNPDLTIGGFITNLYLLHRPGGEVYPGPHMNINPTFPERYVIWLPHEGTP